MRFMASNLSPARFGNLSSNVMVKDKDGKPQTSYHVPKNQELNVEDYNRFKSEYYDYFASNEHVSKGPFATNFGSIVRTHQKYSVKRSYHV